MDNCCSEFLPDMNVKCAENFVSTPSLFLTRYYAKLLEKNGFIDIPVNKLLPGNIYAAMSKTKTRIYKVK